MKLKIFAIFLFFISNQVGCKSLYKELDQAEFYQRVQDRFYVGMDHERTRSAIQGLGLNPQDEYNDISAMVFSRGLPIIESGNELYFVFGESTGLDVVHYYTGSNRRLNDIPHVIELQEEDSP